MNGSKAFASLSPGLLARKGGAKPAMRQQLQPLSEFHADNTHRIDDDLGWDDLGENELIAGHEAEILPINGKDSLHCDKPEILAQQEELSRKFARPVPSRRSALLDGRRAAFTLRIDAERHLRLRLAAAVTNRSAQQLVTEALDELLEQMPDIESLAAKVRKRS